MSLMERFADPSLIDSLSGGDKLVGALITTLMGMGTTFVILVLIWGIIVVMSKILGMVRPSRNVSGKKVSPANVANEFAAPEVDTVAAGEVEAAGGTSKESIDLDSQIAAVITAAIMAADGGFKNNLIVRRINRTAGTSPAWRNAGEADCIDSRKI